MDFQEALEIARRNPGVKVTRGADGKFVVLREDGSMFPLPDLAKDEFERLQQEKVLLQQRYNDICEQLNECRRANRTDIAALNANIHQLQLGQHAAEEALAAAVKTNDQLLARIAKVGAEEWARIKAQDDEERQVHAKERRAERRVQNCLCHGEVENCARCYGRGSYTVDGFGNPVYA